MLIDITLLGVVSLVLIVLWAVMLLLNKKRCFPIFVVAHCLLYVDWFVVQNHFGFTVSAIMLVVSALAGIVKWIQCKKVRFSKELAMYLLISAVPLALHLMVLDVTLMTMQP